MTRMRPPIRRGTAPGRFGPAPLAIAQSAGGAVRRLTPEARAIQHGAFGHALRLGHPHIGGEHHLLALVEADDPAAAVLREHWVTPERVQEQVLLLWGGGLFGDLDRSALAAIGVDVDAVRARVTGAFDTEALQRAGQRVPRPRREGAWWDPRPRRIGPGMHINGVFLPAADDAVQCLHRARLEAQARRDSQIGVVHLALGLLSAEDGLVPPVLRALGVSAPELRSALAAVG